MSGTFRSLQLSKSRLTPVPPASSQLPCPKALQVLLSALWADCAWEKGLRRPQSSLKRLTLKLCEARQTLTSQA